MATAAQAVPVVFDVLPDYLRDSCALTVAFIVVKAFLYVLRFELTVNEGNHSVVRG